MPKISNNTIKVYHKDIYESYNIVVNYNQANKFYAFVPEAFIDIVTHLSAQTLDSMFISTRQDKTFVSASTEAECLSRMEVCLKYMVDKKIQKRNVIIVFYKPKDEMRYNNHLYNNQHPQIGIQFGLTYAVETTVGDKKVYSMYETYEVFGQTETRRHELRLWNEAATIIPDTPESREVLESIYGGFVTLREKLSDLTKTPEGMLELISSGFKMLGE